MDLAERWREAAEKTGRSLVDILREALDLWLIDFEKTQEQEDDK